MSGTAGPYKPKDGWQLRWIKQALHLLFNAPIALVTILVSSLSLGAADIFLQSVVPGPVGYIFSTSIFSAMAACLIAMVCQMFLTAEGIAQSYKALVDGAKPIVITTFLCTSLITTIVMIMHLSRDASGADPFRLPEMSPEEYVLYRGATLIIMAMQSMIIVNPLWHILGPTMNLSLEDAHKTFVRIFVTMPFIFHVLTYSTILISSISMMIGPLAHLFVCTILIAWHYVAAREIYGGISKNNLKKSEELQLSEA